LSEPAQVQRPDVSGGWSAHCSVFSTVWQLSPLAHSAPHPPQFASSLEMSTHAPPQQRSAGTTPQEAPSAIGAATQPAAVHSAARQGSLTGQDGPATQAPASSHASPTVQGSPSEQVEPAASGG
jgi:hypothetical protein